MRRLEPGALSARETAILRDLARVRLLTGRQLERLHFTGVASFPARGSARRRSLGRLSQLGLVTTLPRRVGGERAGSSGLVYRLDARAYRERALWNPPQPFDQRDGQVRRPWAIGWMFVRHTLDVSELYVQLREAEARGELTIVSFEAEPAAWYTPPVGPTIKPDAHVVIESGGWERHWWIEVDRATESLPTLRRKLSRYLDLLHTDQPGPGGVLPQVLITAPHDQRVFAVRAVVEDLRGAPDFVRVCRFDEALDVLLGEEARPPP